MKRINLARVGRRTTCLAISAAALALLLSLPFGVRSQNGTPQALPLQGKTGQVLLLPNATVNAGEIRFQVDTDSDGMPDDAENANGTNPNDPSDADGDSDGDGLTNADEVAGGSNVNNSDSDGDGVSDGQEVQLGFNPNSGASTPPTNANVVALEVGPRALGLVINTLLGPRPAQLVVSARLSNGSSVNITYDAATTYESADASVAVIDSVGTAAGVAPGSTSIVVRRGSLSASIPVSVRTFEPSALTSIAIPGYANNVKVVGDYAYVAAGSAGLRVVDVSNRRAPRIVGALDTNGNADDVRIVGDLAYVADGPAGLKIMNIANRTSPSLLGSVAVPGDAQDVFVQGSRAYLACGSGGLRVVDVSNPAAPVLLGGVATTNQRAHGVSVSGTLAVVADDGNSEPRVSVIDVSDGGNPRVLGTLRLPFAGGSKDVETRGTLAYVAGYSSGFFIVDFSNPASPRVVGSIRSTAVGGFAARDVVLNGNFAVFAEQQFANAVPFVAVNDPTRPRYRGVIDFAPIGDYAGTGIAIDRQYVYMTGEFFIVGPENGSTGDTRLFIGRYDTLDDDAGVAPTIVLDSPRDGQTAAEATTLTLSAAATDDVGVAGVQFYVNGAEFGPQLDERPYTLDYEVPVGAASFVVSARATDFGGNTATSAPSTVTVTPDPPPVVRLTAPAEGVTLVNGETVEFKADASDNGSVARVVFSVGGVELPADTTAPYESAYQVPDGVASLTVTATATDNLGHASTDSRTFTVVTDPLTTVTGSVVAGGGADVTALGSAAQAGADGLFTIGGVPTVRGAVKARAMLNVGGQVFSGASQSLAPARGGVTDVGSFGLAPVGQIVYSARRDLPDGGFEDGIYKAQLDGSGAINLTPNGGFNFGAQVSPDGRQMVFFSIRSCSYGGVWLMNMDGTGERLLDPSAFAYAWSPDSGKLAYTSSGFVWNGSAWVFERYLYVTDRNLLNRRRVPFNTEAQLSDLRWSPDGTKIVFDSVTEGGPSFGQSYDIYSVDVNTFAQTRLTNDAVAKYEPAVSPDGSQVAFVKEDDNDSDDVYVVGAAGSGLRKLTRGGYWYYDIAWSADGSKLAATRELPTGNGSSIVLIDAATGAEQVLVPDDIYNWRPRWSEDGSQLAFLSDVGVQVVESDGLGQRLVNDITGTYELTWMKAATPDPDQLTAVRGRVVNSAGEPVAGARVRVGAEFAATTGADGTFSVADVPTYNGSVAAFASFDAGTRVLSGASERAAPVAGGVTEVGDVRAAEKLAFLTGRDGHWAVYTADADGTHERRLEQDPVDEFRPSLSPDGTRVAFGGGRGAQRILVVNLDGSDEKMLTTDCTGAFDPKWSPDGTKIVFTGRPDDNADIFIINADGSGQTRLTDDPAGDYLADWSPDGSRLVFVSERDGNAELYVMNADGSGLTRLSNTAAYEQEPAWSPDGSKIAFNSNAEGTDAIYLMSPDGTGVARVTPLDAGSFYASWSHDGSRIAFSSTRENGWQIWAIKPDGTGLTRITTNNIGSDFQPDW